MQRELTVIRERLRSVGGEGEELIEEGESRARQASSEIRVLRSNTGLAEARVVQLRVLVDEHRELLRKIQRDETQEGEVRELAELDGFTASLLGGGSGGLPSGSRGSGGGGDYDRGGIGRNQ